MMFLITYGLPHEPLWRLFFQAACSLQLKNPPPLEPDTPLSDVLPPGRCRPDPETPVAKPHDILPPSHKVLKRQHENRGFGLNPVGKRYLYVRNAADLYRLQNLFTVYVHLPPKRHLPEDSLFAGREIDER